MCCFLGSRAPQRTSEALAIAPSPSPPSCSAPLLSSSVRHPLHGALCLSRRRDAATVCMCVCLTRRVSESLATATATTTRVRAEVGRAQPKRPGGGGRRDLAGSWTLASGAASRVLKGPGSTLKTPGFECAVDFIVTCGEQGGRSSRTGVTVPDGGHEGLSASRAVPRPLNLKSPFR